MSKDHIPSDFQRESGYKSDLEIAETQPGVKKINTSFGSKNHNVYVMKRNGTHEHFYVDPKTGRMGWHGANFETKNNKPKNIIQNKNNEGEKNMAERTNAFLEGLKVDQATQNRLAEVSKKAAQNQNQAQNNSSKSKSEGGRERGDTGPGALGRESGAYKGAEPNAAKSNTAAKSTATGHASPSAGHASPSAGHASPSAGHGAASPSAGHGAASTGGHGSASTGGHGSGGQGSGGQGSGGHGSTGGGQGSSGGGQGSSGGGH